MFIMVASLLSIFRDPCSLFCKFAFGNHREKERDSASSSGFQEFQNVLRIMVVGLFLQLSV